MPDEHVYGRHVYAPQIHIFQRQQNSLVNLSLRRNLDDVPKRDTRDSTVLSWGIRVTSQSTVFSHVGGAS